MDRTSIGFVVTAYAVTWVALLAFTWHVQRALRAARATWESANADARGETR